MRRIDYSDPEPAVNLALEEVLLDEVESGRQPDTLRFWESPVPFVVLGTAQVLAEEVREDHCKEDGVPIMRRCSAGGCVLQGPGSLNFALYLGVANCPEVANLHASYRYILGRVCRALREVGVDAAQEGISDIAVAGRKISGNAQRRRRNAILHHGTLLYRADTAAMARYLREPAARPDYRGARDHGAFVMAVAAPPDALRTTIAASFDASGPPVAPEAAHLERARELAREKYCQRSWVYRR